MTWNHYVFQVRGCHESFRVEGWKKCDEWLALSSSATPVETGGNRVFDGPELCRRVLRHHDERTSSTRTMSIDRDVPRQSNHVPSLFLAHRSHLECSGRRTSLGASVRSLGPGYLAEVTRPTCSCRYRSLCLRYPDALCETSFLPQA